MTQKGRACRQAGLAPLLIILVLAGAIVLAGGGYYLDRQNSIFPKSDLDYFIKDEQSLKNRISAEKPIPTPVEDFINSWLTYSSDKYTFKYPPALNAYKTEKDYVRVLFNPGTPDQEAQFSVDSRLLSDYASYDKAVFAARKRFINPQILTIDGGTKISSNFDVGTDREIHIIVVLLKYKQGAVALEYTGNSENISTFNRILSTFNFLDQTSIEGKICGGFAGETGEFACPKGYKCKYPEQVYPDAQGECVKL